jgi:hypothetical protein
MPDPASRWQPESSLSVRCVRGWSSALDPSEPFGHHVLAPYTRQRHFASPLRVLNVSQETVEKTAAAYLLRYGWHRFTKNFRLDFFVGFLG